MKRSFDVLGREVNVLSHRFLEASAGTGKTFAIEHLVVRLLLEHGLALEEILVVTFTRAATRELRQRIRASIERGISQIQQMVPLFDYVRAIVESTEEKRYEAVRCLQGALASFDRAQIFTIHGFCYRMLQEFAFESNVPFDLADPHEESPRLQQQAKIFEFFRTSFKPPHYSLSQIEAVLNKFQNDLRAVADRIAELIEGRYSFPTAFSFQEALALFNNELKKIPALEGEKLLSDMHELAPHFKRVDLEEAERQLGILIKLLDKKECDEQTLDLLLREKRWFFELFCEENLKKRSAPPQDLHYPGIFARFCEKLLPPLQTAKDPLKILIRIAKELKDTPQKGISFDELLHTMAENLASEAFCAKIRRRFRALIVDEFQDTDPVQWKIFQKLFLDPASKVSALYLVGDPKQSIYRFRGADVYTYLEAGELIEEHVSLGTNFRSEKPLVHALNTLFSRKGGGNWLPLPSRGNESLAFVPTKHAKDVGEVESQKGAVHFFLAHAERGREKRFPTTKMESEQFFPFIAKEIEELKSSGLSFRQIAILVKDRFQAERLQEFLRRRAIPSTLARGANLVSSKGFIAFSQLIGALCDPAQIKLVLAGPLFGLTCEELKQISMNCMRDLFSSFRKLCDEKGVARFFSDFLAYEFEGKSILERLISTENLYQELRLTIQRLAEESSCFSCEEIFLFLQTLKKEEDEQPLHTPEQEAISILTIHMSKGLEYEVVFALALASRHTHEESFYFVRDGEKQLIETAIPPFYHEEQDAEKMRQLYVAMTRAKKRVYVPMAFDAAGSVFEQGEGAPIELFFSGEDAQVYLETLGREASITYSLLGKTELLSIESREHEMIPLIPPERPAISQTKRYILSFSSLAKKQEDRERKELELGKEMGPHTLPLGAETGTILHTILEKIFKLGLQAICRKRERESLVQEELEDTPLKGWEGVISEMLEKALSLRLPRTTLSLCELPANKMLQEMEFLLSHHNQLIKGFADLVFSWQDRYYLIDWKSNWLGQNDQAYSLPALEKAMQENDYFLQGAIYATALERYVKLFDTRAFDELFGGAFYIFLRGNAVYHFIPERDACRNPDPSGPGKISYLSGSSILAVGESPSLEEGGLQRGVLHGML